jgi:hypothetical protein
MCDGAASYNALGESCGSAVMNVNDENRGGFTHINTVSCAQMMSRDFTPSTMQKHWNYSKFVMA